MPMTRATACALALAGATLVAGCGNGAVSTDTSLADLGTKMSDPAAATAQQVSDTGQGQEKVRDEGTHDRSCDGGHQRVFRATVTAPLQSGDDQAKVRNTLSLITQAGLKPAGAKVTTDLGKDASTVPATIAFANDPSDEAQKRTYRTTVKLGQDTYTWTITGRTACVAD